MDDVVVAVAVVVAVVVGVAVAVAVAVAVGVVVAVAVGVAVVVGVGVVVGVVVALNPGDYISMRLCTCNHAEDHHEIEADHSYCIAGGCGCSTFVNALPMPDDVRVTDSVFESRIEIPDGLPCPAPFDKLFIHHFLKRTDSGGYLYALAMKVVEVPE